MEFDWIMGCELGWFVGPKFLLCDGLGWIGLNKLKPRTTLVIYLSVQFSVFVEKMTNDSFC